MHCFIARRISTPLDTRLVNRAESRDTTEVSRNVIPLYPPLSPFEGGTCPFSGVERHYGGKSKRHPPLSPFEGGTCPFSGVERHYGGKSKRHPPYPPSKGEHAPSVNRETYYSFMNFTTQALLLL